ncbi:MAG: hypothetical protein Q4G26_10185, partial [Paracoccus sp. (in: a-proteobacteria)]|nr:hypothetical protein [Paracoccus sp. (in: a-proteobacteria)]
MNEQMAKGARVPNRDFALGFQPDGVQLLHRRGGEWAELGRAPFNGDLRGGLGGFAQRLRAANAPGVALVIPEDQILYTDLVLPEARDTVSALKAGLDGLTPYPVEELAFDYAPADAAPGARVRIAAVARQTLAEAEDFAIRHGFAPDRFLAAPEDGQFPHVPDFGATGLATEWALASAELAELELSEPAPEPEPEAPVAAPFLSRVTPHIVAAAAAPVADIAAASVNRGTIILPGESAAESSDTPPPAPRAEAAAPPAPGAEPEGREAASGPSKPLSARARAFHDRAREARQTSEAAGPAPRASRPARAPVRASRGGRRSGLGGALPLVGLLVLGLGISATLLGGNSAPVPVPVIAEAPPETVPPQAQAVPDASLDRAVPGDLANLADQAEPAAGATTAMPALTAADQAAIAAAVAAAYGNDREAVAAPAPVEDAAPAAPP